MGFEFAVLRSNHCRATREHVLDVTIAMVVPHDMNIAYTAIISMFQRILEVIQAQWYIMSAYDISKDCDRLSRFTQNGLTSRLYN